MIDNQLEIKFGGSGNINVETLTDFLENYRNLLYLINSELGYSPDDMIITVSPPENGSFKINISPRFKQVMLKSMGTVVLSTLSGLLVYHLTKPEQVASKEEIKELLIEHQIDNEEIPKYVQNLYHNSGANQQINQTFVIVQNDPNVSNLSITQDDKDVIKIDRSELSNTIMDIDNLEKQEEAKIEVETDEVMLVLKTVHFEGHAKWGFIYRGYPIRAMVRDSIFISKLGSESFRKGDTMRVLLSRRKVYDSELDTFIVDTKSYVIEEVLEHKARISPGRQTEIE